MLAASSNSDVGGGMSAISATGKTSAMSTPGPSGFRGSRLRQESFREWKPEQAAAAGSSSAATAGASLSPIGRTSSLPVLRKADSLQPELEAIKAGIATDADGTAKNITEKITENVTGPSPTGAPILPATTPVPIEPSERHSALFNWDMASLPLGAVSEEATAAVNAIMEVVEEEDNDGEGDSEGLYEGEQDELAWHSIEATAITDPVTGKQVCLGGFKMSIATSSVAYRGHCV